MAQLFTLFIKNVLAFSPVSEDKTSEHLFFSLGSEILIKLQGKKNKAGMI